MMPGAPVWMQPLAAVTLAEGGRRDGSRLLWQQIAKTAQEDWFKAEAARRLAQLDALDQVDQLTAILRAYESRTGEAATTWNALVQRGYLRGAPVDPSGTPYRLDGQAVGLDPRSPLYPLPKQQGRPR
jgi:hypothetical protein